MQPTKIPWLGLRNFVGETLVDHFRQAMYQKDEATANFNQKVRFKVTNACWVDIDKAKWFSLSTCNELVIKSRTKRFILFLGWSDLLELHWHQFCGTAVNFLMAKNSSFSMENIYNKHCDKIFEEIQSITFCTIRSGLSWTLDFRDNHSIPWAKIMTRPGSRIISSLMWALSHAITTTACLFGTRRQTYWNLKENLSCLVIHCS